MDFANEWLKRYQAKWRDKLGLYHYQTPEEVIELALKRAQERQEQSVRQGEYIRSGPFRYPARLEELRWQQTRDIIQRISPGMDEDPVDLERLVRQAASIEIVLTRKHTDAPHAQASALCDRLLLGTTVELDLTKTRHEYRYKTWKRSVVVLSYGLIRFLYQAAKAVVLSWRKVPPQPGSLVGFRDLPEDIDYVLKGDQTPVELLYKTLEDYLFKGYPLLPQNQFSPPPAEYHPPLGLLSNYTERFVIAHEYGHAAHLWFGMDKPGGSSWQKELAADEFAFFMVLISATELDSVAPNMALQGVLFALQGLEILRRALAIAYLGEQGEDVGTKTHPPIHQRISAIEQLYNQHVGIDASYEVPIEGKPGQNKTIDLSFKGALGPIKTLDLLWDRLQPRFLEAYRRGSKLHPIWELDQKPS